MFDFSFSEIALFVVVAMIFIRPKDLPVAIRTLSNGIKAMRRMAGEFQSHIDDMVREADLSETRDQLRDLKNFNIRDRVTRAIDGDNSIRRSLELETTGTSSRPSTLNDLPQVPAPPPMPPPSFGGGDSKPYNAMMQDQAEEGLNDDIVDAPSILPPATARRLMHERPRWRAPDILPPVMAIHHGRRVAISSTEKDA